MNGCKILTVILLLLFCGSLFGCGGGGAKLETTTTTVTLGQQLIDLNKAYKDGALDEKQYKKSKDNLLKKYY